jgi:hypothetical protein
MRGRLYLPWPIGIPTSVGTNDTEGHFTLIGTHKTALLLIDGVFKQCLPEQRTQASLHCIYGFIKRSFTHSIIVMR